MLNLEFETITTNLAGTIHRAKVPGGWLVMSVDEVLTDSEIEHLRGFGYEWRSSICFVPDPEHKWLEEVK